MATSVNSIFGNFDADDMKGIKQGLTTITDSMSRIQAEKESISDVIGAIHDQYKLPPKIIRRMAKTMYKQSFEVESSEYKEFEAIYIGLTETK